ncbi:hypothetical protein CDL15_Pgr013084 [Punica granatum]|uniref:Uncharacterized protein n=1 Tax=Punica granatum TaxID=22663 RepID=A0A218WJ01_PUNGR|nr:hypothetical protein CDL15_Pgr013084 [Punica granatum]
MYQRPDMIAFRANNLPNYPCKIQESRLTRWAFHMPMKIKSDEMLSMSEMDKIVLNFKDKKLPAHHIPGLEDV